MEHRLTILLVEDDTDTCRRILNYIDLQENAVLVGVTNNAVKAIRLIHDTLPDALILDLELHHGGGDGLQVLQSLRQHPAARMPYILITTNNSSQVTYEAARQLGADFILAKYQDGYSPEQAVDFLIAIKNAIQSNKYTMPNKEPLYSPAELESHTRRRIRTALDSVGISPKALGYAYLQDGIHLLLDGTASNLSAAIAAQYQKTPASIERAMQNAINRAWKTTAIDDLLENYTAKIHSERGIPTVTEFTCYFANKIREDLID